MKGARRRREPLRNEFSWSRSRARVFNECPRRYFYAYYGSWGGWENDAPERVRRLYVLKRLKTRQMWAGEVVHGVAERVLKDLRQGVTVVQRDEVLQAALARMRADFRFSREGRYWQRPKRLALFEHEYELPVSDEDWKGVADHVATCVLHFFESDVYARLQRFPSDDFLEIEQLSTFAVSGVKVWVKLDCCLRSAPGVFVIDWKTGRADRGDHGQQLAAYALYAAQHWGVEPRYIQTLVYNLSVGRGQTYKIKDETVAAARAEIAESAAKMRSYLIDPTGGNEARPEEEFPLAEDERACRYCNFRSACQRFAAT